MLSGRSLVVSSVGNFVLYLANGDCFSHGRRQTYASESVPQILRLRAVRSAQDDIVVWVEEADRRFE